MVAKRRFRAREPPGGPRPVPFVMGTNGADPLGLVFTIDTRESTMRHPLALALAALLATAPLYAQAQDPSPVSVPPPIATAPQAQDNPFFQESPLPLHYPQFDRIQDSDFAPAFERGMADELAEVAAIADNPAPATFENTIVALQKAGRTLNRAQTVFYSLVGADTNDAREKLRAEYAPKFSAHSDAIVLNPALFARIEAIHDGLDGSGLEGEDRRLVEKYHENFVRAGANLPDADKARLKAINAELAQLGTTFSQNVLSEVNASAVVVDSRAELAGLPEADIDAAAAAAKKRGLDGKFVIALQNTTGQPPNTYLENRALRQRIHEASVARGSRGNEFDNTGLVSQIMKLRLERAKLLGYPDYASFVLADETAKTPQAVNEMLGRLAPAAVANAFAGEQCGASLVPPAQPVQRGPQAVEDQRLVHPVVLLTTDPKRRLVLTHGLGVVLLLPMDDPERVANGQLAAVTRSRGCITHRAPLVGSRSCPGRPGCPG